MKLEFGGGDKPRLDFLQVDIRSSVKPNFLCNAWDIHNYVDSASVEHIYSRHFLEHLTFSQAEETFKSWKTILKPGGILEIIVPDMLFHINQWLNPKRAKTINPNGLTDLDWAIAGFWGHQREIESEVWDLHKAGYDYPLLKAVLTQHGFNNIKQEKSLKKNLHVTALNA